MHARGIERRKRLLAAARAMLSERELDDISLGDVAVRAGVPKGSAYHFYDDIGDLYANLLVSLQTELLEDQRRPIRARVRGWQDVVAILTRRGMDYYNRNPAARQLQIGPKTPPELKRRDRHSDAAIGRLIAQHLEVWFELPAIPNLSAVFFRAVEIADLMFSLSVLDNATVTVEMCAEAERAMTAYLQTYLTATLPSRRTRIERR
ncbi:MAG: TetR family transcriptional regulator [Proteobacteria bacterium]|nr:TetR family transcriptional regulator [Pseudomonadota bacterium]